MSLSPEASGVAPTAVPALPVEVPSLDNNYGAIMLGTFGGLMLYGLTMHQGYRYLQLQRSKAESVYIRILVAFALTMETAHSVLSMHVCYYSFVINYCRPDVLFQASGSWSQNLLPIFTGIIITVSQSFFAYRLFRFERRHALIAAFVFILILGELGLCTALTVESFIKPGLSNWKPFNLRLTSAALGMAFTADAILTILLTIALHRSRTGFKSTDSRINVLIMYTINTGLLTGTITAISFFVTLFSDTLINDALTILAAKLYANSMLAVLNSRDSLSGHGKADFKGNAFEIDAMPGFALPSSPSTTRSAHDAHATSHRVLHIRVARQTSPAGSFSGSLVDHKAEPSFELRELRSSSESKGDDAPPYTVSHDGER